MANKTEKRLQEELITAGWEVYRDHAVQKWVATCRQTSMCGHVLKNVTLGGLKKAATKHTERIHASQKLKVAEVDKAAGPCCKRRRHVKLAMRDGPGAQDLDNVTGHSSDHVPAVAPLPSIEAAPHLAKQQTICVDAAQGTYIGFNSGGNGMLYDADVGGEEQNVLSADDNEEIRCILEDVEMNETGPEEEERPESYCSAAQGTAEWYRRNRFTPILPGHTMSALQVAYTVAQMRKDGMTLAMAESVLTLIRQILQGTKGANSDDICCPPSMHIVRSVMEAQQPEKYRFWWCQKCGQRFESEADMRERPTYNGGHTSHESCHVYRHCHQCGTSLKQAKKGWDFGVENVLSSINNNPDVFEGAKAYLDFQDPLSMWGSPYGKALDRACSHVFSDSNGQQEHRPDSRPTRAAAHSCGLYVLGGDGGQAFKTRNRSVTVIGLRRADVSTGVAAKQCTWRILLVLEGPSEPSHLGSILQRTVNFFIKHNPGRRGCCEPWQMPASLGSGFKEPVVQHWPVLGYIQGDTPFMEKLMNTAGSSSYRPCYRCCIKGKYMQQQKTIRLLGYSSVASNPELQCATEMPSFSPGGDPAPCIPCAVRHEDGAWDAPYGYIDFRRDTPPPRPRLSWSSTQLGVPWDSRFKFTAPEMLARARRAQRNWETLSLTVTKTEEPEKRLENFESARKYHNEHVKEAFGGVKGLPIFSQLSYFRIENYAVYPLAHLCLYGVHRDFWRVWLQSQSSARKQNVPVVAEDNTTEWQQQYTLPTSIRQQIRARSAWIKGTSQYKTPYSDITTYIKSWTMESHLDWVGTFSRFALHRLDWSGKDCSEECRIEFESQWELLSAGIQWVFRGCGYEHSSHTLEAAQAVWDKYAKRVEEAFDGQLLTTYKLHVIVRHLVDQLACMGPGKNLGEWWIERMIHSVKLDLAQARVDPETVFATTYTLEQAAANCRNNFPEHCKNTEEFKKKPSPHCQADFDTGEGGHPDVLLLHKRIVPVDPPKTKFCRTRNDLAYWTSRVLQLLPGYLWDNSEDFEEWGLGWPLPGKAITRQDYEGSVARVISDMFEDGTLSIDYFHQASLSNGDILVANGARHSKTDNRWCYLNFDQGQAESSGDTLTAHCVGRVTTFFRLTSRTFTFPIGLCKSLGLRLVNVGTPGDERVVPAQPLRMAMLDLWRATDPGRPRGVSVNPFVDALLGGWPYMLEVSNISTEGPILPWRACLARNQSLPPTGPRYYGVWLTDVASIICQLVPTKKIHRSTKGTTTQARYFMFADKTSGQQ